MIVVSSSSQTPTFGTAINCIDGRAQVPVIAWMRERLAVDYVDMVTQPGADAFLADHADEADHLVRPRVAVSVEKHSSMVVAIVGHHGCAANPATPEAHREQLLRAVQVVRRWEPDVKVIALWLNERWEIDVVQTRS